MQYAHIRQLSSDVIGQIAAGEVVERPSAAIKELVENSMDAGATAITVEIKDGGLNSFRVVDNGSGIQPSDIRLAFARHATSKISKTDDLYGIQTLGFRGEALASIAAVAKVTCTTRVHGAETGIAVQNSGGDMGEIKEAACPEGTSFLVKDLFFNAPVRRKFLKKPATETGYISDLMMRFILSHPQISFRYVADGKNVYFSAGDGKLESAVMSVYGLSTLEKLRRVQGNMNGVLLDGYVGVGDLSRGNRSHQSFILNGRLIKSNLLAAALEEACRQRVMIGKFPLCVLHLTMPFESADVNVHPNKWEVRFQNEPAIREAVQTLVYDALQFSSPIEAAEPLFPPRQGSAPVSILQTKPEQFAQKVENHQAKVDNIDVEYKNYIPEYKNIERDPIFNAPLKPAVPAFPDTSSSFVARSNVGSVLPPVQPLQSGFTKNAYSQTNTEGSDKQTAIPPKDAASTLDPASAPLPQIHTEQANQIEQTKLNEADSQPAAPVQANEQTELPPIVEQFNEIPVRLIGVVFDTYILLETPDRMLLCDQHAVHERLLYEKMIKAFAGDAAAQQLLVPEMIRLTHREFEIFKASEQVLLHAGFDASEFGDLTVQLRSVPMVLGSVRGVDCFRDALDDLAECGQISDQRRTDRIIQMACKHAVKGGERATMAALMELVRRMLRDNVTPTCPHGRPLIIEVSRRDLEKRFHRIQN